MELVTRSVLTGASGDPIKSSFAPGGEYIESGKQVVWTGGGFEPEGSDATPPNEEA